jgi:hypothetical protein
MTAPMTKVVRVTGHDPACPCDGLATVVLRLPGRVAPVTFDIATSGDIWAHDGDGGRVGLSASERTAAIRAIGQIVGKAVPA